MKWKRGRVRRKVARREKERQDSLKVLSDHGGRQLKLSRWAKVRPLQKARLNCKDCVCLERKGSHSNCVGKRSPGTELSEKELTWQLCVGW